MQTHYFTLHKLIFGRCHDRNVKSNIFPNKIPQEWLLTVRSDDFICEKTHRI